MLHQVLLHQVLLYQVLLYQVWYGVYILVQVWCGIDILVNVYGGQGMRVYLVLLYVHLAVPGMGMQYKRVWWARWRADRPPVIRAMGG